MSNAPFKIFQVRGDGGERSAGPVIGYCSSESRANEMGKGKGFYGSQGAVSETWAVRIGNDVYALVSSKPVDLDGLRTKADDILRKETIASLTPEQRRVLKIKE